MEPIISVRELARTYIMGEIEVPALQGVSFDIYPGEFVAIMGPSGSGKSTLMNLLGCLDTPTSGEYILDGIPTEELEGDMLASVRNRKIGFVFQQFNLLPRSTALENVELPLIYRGKLKRDERHNLAIEALEMVGLGDRMEHHPRELSGGQQQRVAIARALVTHPAILLADEPTGNLDSHSSEEVMQVVEQLNRQGITIILVTHEHDVAMHAHRIITIRDGLVASDTLSSGRQTTDDRRPAAANLVLRSSVVGGPPS